MASKKKYLFAVQRASGHELVSATLEVAKIGDVEAQRLPDGTVRLVHDGDIVAVSSLKVDEVEEIQLHRWPAGKKLSDPVTKDVPTYGHEES